MSDAANHLVEHFFRYESANLVAVMTRAFGVHRMDLVEDMVQVAMLEAMRTWEQRGVPDNPAAWIHRAAKNRILDALRREKVHEQALANHEALVGDVQESKLDLWLEEERIPDSLLRMIFVCCHSSLERDTQISLTLKTLCGFSIAEIARGLLLPEETIKKRLQRAKKALAESKVQLDLPSDAELGLRLEVVHEVLYLLFNEGYSTSKGSAPIRDDICEEAVRLCHLLCESAFASPTTRALFALLLFHSARLESRTDEAGKIVLLEDQDRSKWNSHLIDLGRCWLLKSKSERPTTFHLEATIAMQHCVASSVETTDWATIVQLYDRLLDLRDSPIYSLNRAIALGQSGDATSAISQLHQLRNRPEMGHYILLDCAIARMHELQGDKGKAVDCYLDALAKKTAPHEKELLKRKLAQIAD